MKETTARGTRVLFSSINFVLTYVQSFRLPVIVDDVAFLKKILPWKSRKPSIFRSWFDTAGHNCLFIEIFPYNVRSRTLHFSRVESITKRRIRHNFREICIVVRVAGRGKKKRGRNRMRSVQLARWSCAIKNGVDEKGRWRRERERGRDNVHSFSFFFSLL